MNLIKAVILCGGLGTRFSEETLFKPKPMIEIGKYPILLNIVKIYNDYNISDFIIATGYKHEYINHYFNKVFPKISNQNVKKKKFSKFTVYEFNNFNITIYFTGNNSLTGGRIKRLNKILKKEDNFFCTYGDGVSDINIKKLYNFHIKHNKIATLTSVRPPARFGRLKINGNLVTSFSEKPQLSEGRINGGFFVLKKEIFNLIKGDNVNFEKEVLPKIAKRKQLTSYKHNAYWRCMDTLRDKLNIEKDIKSKKYKIFYEK